LQQIFGEIFTQSPAFFRQYLVW